jgi:transcriptional regulator with XRE-family HTH domain
MGGATRSLRYRKFLKKLRVARKAAGLTQVEVAQILNQPQSYVSRCESGERRVDIVDLSDFAAIYGQPLSYFVDKSPFATREQKPTIQEEDG